MRGVGVGGRQGKADRIAGAGGDASAAAGAAGRINRRGGPPTGFQTEPYGAGVAVIFAGPASDAIQRHAALADHGLPVPGLPNLQGLRITHLNTSVAKGAFADLEVQNRQAVAVAVDDGLWAGAGTGTALGAGLFKRTRCNGPERAQRRAGVKIAFQKGAFGWHMLRHCIGSRSFSPKLWQPFRQRIDLSHVSDFLVWLWGRCARRMKSVLSQKCGVRVRIAGGPKARRHHPRTIWRGNEYR